MASGLNRAEIEESDQKNRKEQYLPVDVAGYIAAGGDGKPSDRFAGIWIESKQVGDDARMLAGATAADHQAAQNRLKAAGMAPMNIQAARATDGSTRYCGVCRTAELLEVPAPLLDQSEINLAGSLATNAWSTPTEISVTSAPAPPTTAERATAILKEAEAAIKAKADDLDARFRRAFANVQLGNHRASIEDLDALLLKAPQAPAVLQYRAMAHARLHHKKEALDDVTAYRKADGSEYSKLYLAVVVAAELAEGLDEAFEKLESAVRTTPNDSGLYYDAACAYALTARALKTRNPAKSQEHRARAIALLKEAIRVGYSDYDHIQEDPDFDPIRELPAFGEIMSAGHADRRLTALWSSDVRFESVPLFGLDPAAHDAQCRKLIGEGFRPVSISVASTAPDRPPVTASVWQRPVMSDDVKDALAMRQARAAIALVRLGKPDAVWPLLRHSADPRLRSFIVNWLNPLGADPQPLAAELARLESNPRPAQPGEGGRRPGEGSAAQAAASVGRGSPGTRRVAAHPPTAGLQPDAIANVGRGSPGTRRVAAHPPTEGLRPNTMAATLFDPETSIRRALILSLGTYATDRLSPADREPLITKLLDLYENDPDSGTHGAAEWILRRWGQQAKLTEADERLTKLDFKARGPRRWYVNSRRQTLALIEGSVEFRMGSPPSEPDRIAKNETPHRRVVPRKFAIAAKEVTVEEYQAFAAENPDHELPVDQYSPDRKGPMNRTSWFDAAAYCNWLSRKEGLEECYEPNSQKKYAEGMTVRADALRRSGYRLPTEAEWEYSCRAGAESVRYHGSNLDLLPAYTLYQKSSGNRAWPGGGVFPNDLGLFDTLGNVWEWCQEGPLSYRPDRTGIQVDDVSISEAIGTDRLLRGGAFSNRPSYVRSAYRNWNQPANRVIIYGFRPARTYR
jgi:formylglycine-generating enzyme required for sulfatase activity